MSDDQALIEVLRRLKADGYVFVTPTPATHAVVLGKKPKRARSLRDVLGWSLPFDEGLLAPALFDLLQAGGALRPEGKNWKSRFRVSSLDDRLYLHSAYPTDGADSVFFGPDSYRFASFVRARMTGRPAVVADIGAGAGVGGLTAAELAPSARVVLTDVNPEALRLARINAEAAGIAVETRLAEGCDGLPEAVDLILANPPYMVDDQGRAYRDGGELHGGALSLDWARQAIGRLKPGGRLLLYTGSAIVDGVDHLKAELAGLAGAGLAYRELDPDVFGEELCRPAYAAVERIALVGAVLTRL